MGSINGFSCVVAGRQVADGAVAGQNLLGPSHVSSEEAGVITLPITGVNERNEEARPPVTDVNHKVHELIRISD